MRIQSFFSLLLDNCKPIVVCACELRIEKGLHPIYVYTRIFIFPCIFMYTRLQTVWSLPGHSRQANKDHSPLCHRRPNGPGRLADKVVQPTTQSVEGCTFILCFKAFNILLTYFRNIENAVAVHPNIAPLDEWISFLKQSCFSFSDEDIEQEVIFSALQTFTYGHNIHRICIVLNHANITGLVRQALGQGYISALKTLHKRLTQSYHQIIEH